MQELNSLAIIPARGGSKRIPKKNIKNFLGKPIIQYSIEAALKSYCFDEVMVSTDNKEIAGLAESLGARIPFMRSARNADDYSGIAEVVLEVLTEYDKIGKTFKYICCILPTAPFISVDKLQKAYTILLNKNYDTVIPIVKYGYPVQRSFRLKESKISMLWPENYDKRSQDLDPIYHDSGQFAWVLKTSLVNKKQFFTENSGAIILSEMEVQDIDNENDWLIAEMKYKLLKGQGKL